MLTPQESELLLRLHAAPGAGWPPFLAELAARTGAGRALLFPDCAEGRAPPAALRGLRLGRVYLAEELSGRAPPGEAGIIGSDARALGVGRDGAAGWLLIERDRGSFRAVDSALLSGLAPHLAAALARAAEGASLRARLAAAEDLARRLGAGRICFDARGQVRTLETGAADLLAHLAPGVQPAAPPGPDPALVALAPGLEMLCLTEACGHRTGWLRATALPLPAPEVIAAALGISRAEARLARALGMGATLAEAAARLGLTVETARAYSRTIYARTGLRGQPDLMRRLWTGALILGRDAD